MYGSDKVSMKRATVAQTLARGQHISAIAKDYHVRRQGGEYLCYIVEDKQGALLVSQKLGLLADYINSHVVHEKPDQVTISSLYQIIGCSGGRTGGWAKHRFRVRPVPLEKAPEALESVRRTGEYASCTVLGSPEVYQIEAS